MSTRLFKKNALLLAKRETTYGEDAIPTAASNAMLVRNMSINPMEGSAVDLEYIRPWYGQDASLRVSTYVTCQFDTDWVPGAAQAGTASAFSPLLRACGLSETAQVENSGTSQAGANAETGTLQSGSTLTTVKLASGASATDDFYNGRIIRLANGIERTITDYVGSTKVATVARMPSAPGLITYSIRPSIKLASGASATNGIYDGMTVVVGSQTRAITGYNGATKVATVDRNWGTVPGTDSYTIRSAMNYDPVSGSFDSATLYYNVGGVLHKLLGCRGTFTTKLAANEIPSLSFTFTGIYGGVSDVALTTPTYDGFGTPVAVNSANTRGTLFGYEFTGGTAGLQVASLSFDLGNTVNYRLLVGSESVIIPDRKPKGSISLEMTTVAFHDWMTAVKDGWTGRFYMENGNTQGLTVAINMPRVQLENPRYSESDGIVMLDLDVRALWNAGNDEIRYIEK